jgi:hypothetical protein
MRCRIDCENLYLKLGPRHGRWGSAWNWAYTEPNLEPRIKLACLFTPSLCTFLHTTTEIDGGAGRGGRGNPDLYVCPATIINGTHVGHMRDVGRGLVLQGENVTENIIDHLLFLPTSVPPLRPSFLLFDTILFLSFFHSYHLSSSAV